MFRALGTHVVHQSSANDTLVIFLGAGCICILLKENHGVMLTAQPFHAGMNRIGQIGLARLESCLEPLFAPRLHTHAGDLP